MRWSQASVDAHHVADDARAAWSRSATAFGSSAPTASSAACGGLITAEKLETPNIPRFETVNVPPESSGGVICPSRTFCASARERRGDLAQRLLVGVEDRRDHERILRGDGDPDVDPRVDLDVAVAVGAVGARELP